MQNAECTCWGGEILGKGVGSGCRGGGEGIVNGLER